MADPRRFSRRGAARRGQRHLVAPRRAPGVDYLLDRVRGRIEIDDLERAVAVASIRAIGHGRQRHPGRSDCCLLRCR